MQDRIGIASAPPLFFVPSVCCFTFPFLAFVVKARAGNDVMDDDYKYESVGLCRCCPNDAERHSTPTSISGNTFFASAFASPHPAFFIQRRCFFKPALISRAEAHELSSYSSSRVGKKRRHNHHGLLRSPAHPPPRRTPLCSSNQGIKASVRCHALSHCGIRRPKRLQKANTRRAQLGTVPARRHLRSLTSFSFPTSFPRQKTRQKGEQTP